MRRVIVCGGRRYGLVKPERDFVSMTLYRLLRVRSTDQTTVVTGGAPGVDRVAQEAALAWGLQVEVHPANWNRYGTSAGPRRNQKLVDGGASLVVAFPGGPGTADCVRRARVAGIPIEEPRP